VEKMEEPLQFRLASGLAEASEERQVSSLMYCMSGDAEDILATTDISEEHTTPDYVSHTL